MAKPTVTIVTATWNRASFLQGAIESVLAQGYDTVQHVVIDGASTDGTIELLRSYPHLEVRSEADRGLYDAWNKGLELAEGDIVGFLNDDDQLAEGALNAVASAFAATPDTDSVCGAAELVGAGGEVICAYSPSELSFDVVSLGSAITNARFFRRPCLSEIGAFDPTLQIVGDREWLLRAWERNVTTTCIPDVVYRYGQHEEALTMNLDQSGGHRAVEETLRVCENRLSDPATQERSKQLIKSWFSVKLGFAFRSALWSRDLKRARMLLRRGNSVKAWPLLWLLFVVRRRLPQARALNVI